MRYESSGVSGAGFTTIEQPDSSAGASFDIVTNCGTFHGTMPATTPTGSRRTITSPNTPGRCSSHGYDWAMVMKALSIIQLAGACARFEKLMGEPISSVMTVAMSPSFAA